MTTPSAQRPLFKDDPRHAPERLLLRVEDVAALLDIGRSTVYDLLRDQRLPSVKIGGSRRITRAAVDAFVHGLTQQQDAAVGHEKARR